MKQNRTKVIGKIKTEENQNAVVSIIKSRIHGKLECRRPACRITRVGVIMVFSNGQKN